MNKFVLPTLLCNIFHVKGQQGTECIEAKNVTRRFREWSKCSMHMWKRCLEAKGLVDSSGITRNPNVPNYSIVGKTFIYQGQGKVTGYTVTTFHGSDLSPSLSPMIGCRSCRFEIDTSSSEPPPSRHLRSKTQAPQETAGRHLCKCSCGQAWTGHRKFDSI